MPGLPRFIRVLARGPACAPPLSAIGAEQQHRQDRLQPGSAEVDGVIAAPSLQGSQDTKLHDHHLRHGDACRISEIALKIYLIMLYNNNFIRTNCPNSLRRGRQSPPLLAPADLSASMRRAGCGVPGVSLVPACLVLTSSLGRAYR